MVEIARQKPNEKRSQLNYGINNILYAMCYYFSTTQINSLVSTKINSLIYKAICITWVICALNAAKRMINLNYEASQINIQLQDNELKHFDSKHNTLAYKVSKVICLLLVSPEILYEISILRNRLKFLKSVAITENEILFQIFK